MSEEFCDGVKILLKRMESNPEEFRGSKWSDFITIRDNGNWENVLTKAEHSALKEGMQKIYRGVFTTQVISRLLDDRDEMHLSSAFMNTKLGQYDPRLAQNAINPYSVFSPQPTDSLERDTARQAKALGLIGILKERFKNL